MRCEIPCLDTPDTHEHPSAADKAQTLEQKKKKIMSGTHKNYPCMKLETLWDPFLHINNSTQATSGGFIASP